MRLLALAAAALALLAWLRRERPEPVQPDAMDDVQWDPWVRALSEPGTRQALDEGLADLAAGRMRIRAGDWDPNEATLEPLTAADRDWLDQTVRSTQAQLMGPFPWRDPFRRSTQTGPLGPTA
jgi:hypothetical protein